MKRLQNINIYCTSTWRTTDVRHSTKYVYVSHNHCLSMSHKHHGTVNKMSELKWSRAMSCFRLKNSTTTSAAEFNYKYIFCWIVWSMARDKDTCDFSYACSEHEDECCNVFDFYRSFYFGWCIKFAREKYIRFNWRYSLAVRLHRWIFQRQSSTLSRWKYMDEFNEKHDMRKTRSQLACDVNGVRRCWLIFRFFPTKNQQLCVSSQFDFMLSITIISSNHLRVPFDVM